MLVVIDKSNNLCYFRVDLIITQLIKAEVKNDLLKKVSLWKRTWSTTLKNEHNPLTKSTNSVAMRFYSSVSGYIDTTPHMKWIHDPLAIRSHLCLYDTTTTCNDTKRIKCVAREIWPDDVMVVVLAVKSMNRHTI